MLNEYCTLVHRESVWVRFLLFLSSWSIPAATKRRVFCGAGARGPCHSGSPGSPRLSGGGGGGSAELARLRGAERPDEETG